MEILKEENRRASHARRRAVKQASLSVTRFYFAGDCARLMNGRIFN